MSAANPASPQPIPVHGVDASRARRNNQSAGGFDHDVGATRPATTLPGSAAGRSNTPTKGELVQSLTRVFLLDDHEIARRGVADLLNSVPDLQVVGEAGTVAEALRRLPAAEPDVAILDGRLPDGSGIEVCRIIREQSPGVKCLILTSYDDDEAIFAAVLAGAAGYVLKHIRGSNLIDAVRQVAAGQSLLDPTVTARVLQRIREGKREDARLATLNAQQRKILILIAEGLTNRQIGERLFLAEKTVKNNVSSLLAKLGMQRRTQAAVFGANLKQHDNLPDIT
jgi:two-component system response regulator DevR